jgi:MoxR-like ATPase
VTPAIEELRLQLEREGYIAEPAIATAVFLMQEMGKPLLVEGDAGVGKTELAKVLARLQKTELIRLQCYQGLDVQTALYEWDYPRQMLRLRIAEVEAAGLNARAKEGLPRRSPSREARNPLRVSQTMSRQIFSRDYLLERPLLSAITRAAGPAVLLIDEVDRADDEFEAFLLEVLSDWQVTIPELGPIRAVHPPTVLLTSNRTRELGDALRRRCLYLYIDHPSFEKEVRIIRSRCPDTPERLSQEIAGFVAALRARPLIKPPGVAETLDFTRALLILRRETLEPEVVAQTLLCLLKDGRDLETVTGADLTALVAQAQKVQL